MLKTTATRLASVLSAAIIMLAVGGCTSPSEQDLVVQDAEDTSTTTAREQNELATIAAYFGHEATDDELRDGYVAEIDSRDLDMILEVVPNILPSDDALSEAIRSGPMELLVLRTTEQLAFKAPRPPPGVEDATIRGDTVVVIRSTVSDWEYRAVKSWHKVGTVLDSLRPAAAETPLSDIPE